MGYASTNGLAWLARRTRNRAVRLLIGNYQAKYFKEASPEKRDEALALLERDDVIVFNWYRRHGQRSDAHLKVWIAHREYGPPAILNGSANLSERGLYHNREIMTSVRDEEVEQIVQLVEDLIENAWDVKSKIRDYIQGRVRSTGPRDDYQPNPRERGTRTMRRRLPSTPPRRPARKRKAGFGCSTFLPVLLALMALLFLINYVIPNLDFTSNDSGSGSGMSETAQSAEVTQPGDHQPSIPAELSGQDPDVVPANPTTRESPHSSDQPEQVESQTSTTMSQGETLVVDPLTADYVQGIVEVQASLEDVLVAIRAVNRDWDNRNETGLAYAEAEAVLIDINDQVQTLHDRVRYQRVPIVLRGIHGRPEGPVQQSAKLPPLAEAILAGLQIPAPNDGTARRTALLEFDSAAQDFFNSVEHVLKHVEKNAEALGLTNSPASTTTTHPPVPLTDEGLSYVEGLMRFKETMAHLVTELNAANQAWDNQETTNASFSQTESAIASVVEQSQALHQQVRDFPVPRPVRVLGEDPPRKAATLAESASRVLSGLRIPAPDPGFERLAALDDFNAAAERFEDSINHVVSEVYAKAHKSGLAKES